MTREDKAREARYEKQKIARAEVERRLRLAVDRLDVALAFQSPGSATVAQLDHARHYLQRGWAGSHDQSVVPPESPDFQLGDEDAEELTRLLARLIELARNSKWTWGQRE